MTNNRYFSILTTVTALLFLADYKRASAREISILAIRTNMVDVSLQNFFKIDNLFPACL